jgi:hypothetical protein
LRPEEVLRIRWGNLHLQRTAEGLQSPRENEVCPAQYTSDGPREGSA